MTLAQQLKQEGLEQGLKKGLEEGEHRKGAIAVIAKNLLAEGIFQQHVQVDECLKKS